jgi:hypothetical protein
MGRGAVIALLLVAAACTKHTDSTAGTSTTASGGSGTTSGSVIDTVGPGAGGGASCPSTALSSGNDRVKVVVGDCTYQGAVSPNCSDGLVVAGTFTYFYQDQTVTEGLSSLQIGMSDASGGPTSDFSAEFTVGPFRDATTNFVTTQVTGLLTLQGGAATITGSGKTDAGVSVSIEADCSAVES